MTRFDDKAELYAVVGELHERNWTIPTIALAVGCTDTHVRAILADLGLHRPVRFQSFEAAIASLDESLAERVLKLRDFGIRTSRQHEDVGGA